MFRVPIIYPEYMVNSELQKKFPFGYINLGLAHGILGPLYILALGFKKFNNYQYLRAVEKGLQYYEKSLHVNDEGISLGWNGRIAANLEKREFTYNPSWCYGSIGIARVLYKISEIINNKNLRNITIEVLRSFVNYLDHVDEIYNNAICHGKAGVMLIYNNMYSDTGESLFKEYSDRLYVEILNSATDSLFVFTEKDIYFRGKLYDEIIEYVDFGILNGISGIVLSLIAKQEQDISPLYDMFFI